MPQLRVRDTERQIVLPVVGQVLSYSVKWDWRGEHKHKPVKCADSRHNGHQNFRRLFATNEDGAFRKLVHSSIQMECFIKVRRTPVENCECAAKRGRSLIAHVAPKTARL